MTTSRRKKMLELLSVLIICSTLVVITLGVTRRPITITVVHQEPEGKSDEEIASGLIKQQELLDEYYSKNGNKVPTYDDVLAEVNAMLKGEDVDG